MRESLDTFRLEALAHLEPSAVSRAPITCVGPTKGDSNHQARSDPSSWVGPGRVGTYQLVPAGSPAASSGRPTGYGVLRSIHDLKSNTKNSSSIPNHTRLNTNPGHQYLPLKLRQRNHEPLDAEKRENGRQRSLQILPPSSL